MYKDFERILQDKELTLYKVSKETGISKNTLYAWRDGLYTPKIDKLQKIAEYLNVTVNELQGNEKKPLTDDEELNEYLEELKNRKEMRMLFNLAKGATKADVEQAVKIIEALRK